MTFKDLLHNNLSDLDYLKKKNIYIAHIPQKNNSTKKETLEEHTKLVEKYFLKLIEKNQLEPVINKLIETICKQFKQSEKIELFVKTLFFNSIIYHDFGKINHEFQIKKMENSNTELIKIKHNESSHHSVISAYIFLNHHLKLSESFNFNAQEQTLADFFTSCFIFPIFKHHSSFLPEIKSNKHFLNDNIEKLFEFLQLFEKLKNFDDKVFTNDTISKIETAFKSLDEFKIDFDFFPLFALLKLNWSLLTASDYYATSEYMNDIKFETDEDFGLLTETLKQNIYENFTNNKEKKFNRKLIQNHDYYLNYPFDNLQIPNYDNLKILRQKLGAEVLAGIERYKDERVFYIEAPTGGGKTNMSMLAIYKLLQLHTEINKVFYVFPFTTLITQTDKAIKETYGLTGKHVAQVHSKAGFQTKNDDEDANYGNKFRNQIDNLFVNYPFILLTHIKFFDILKANDKQSNYLLHRLANSIVIIDELQAYSPAHWDKIKYFISNYAELFNVRFIIMSATLPKISNIAIGENETIKFHHLIENAQEKYLQNPNFSKRVVIKTDLLNSKHISIPELAEFTYNKSRNYAETRTDKYNGSVHTIIEFIFKKSATEFYDYIIENDLFSDYEKFVLSGTIIEPRRKYIINYLKDERNRKKKVLLITTQVVEAGVDIDMDLGFKNQSLIDSDEQLAGRINRNVKKQNCELYLFNYDNPNKIYGKDDRFKIAQSFSLEKKQKILQDKRFDLLYEEVMLKIEKDNNSAYKDGFNEYKGFVKTLNFEKINREFKLIENDTSSIFVPANIDVLNYEFINEKTKEVKIENNFSPSELAFIKKNNCLANDNKISGEKVWNLYISIIQNKKPDLGNKSIDLKILNGIMSKFVFSIYTNKLNELKGYFEYNEEHHDFKYIQYYKLCSNSIGNNQIYEIESGLNEKILKNTYDFF